MMEGKLSRRDLLYSSSLLAAGTLADALAGRSDGADDKRPAGVPSQADVIWAIIQQAGNADSDELRLDYLKKLQQQPGLDASFQADLGKLIGQIDRWLHEKQLDYFGSEVRRNKDYDFQITESSVLSPLTWLYRGRMAIWYAMESGSVWSIPESRREFFAIARGFFGKYAAAFPENRIARMYLGHPTGPYKHYEAAPGAPAWAVYQREALERLADIIEWWIDNRMQEDGQYGGGWGDDCEMWRWWVPVLIGFESPKITQAQARFSRALMNQPHMKQGYTTRMSDVEHTAEDSADAVTPMMHLDPESDLWRQYALRLADFMEERWTARNERGFLQFKSTYFTAETVDTNPQRACDTVYHPRVIQPTLLYWQRTGDERLTKLFAAWMDTWVDAAARAERGKPPGIIPTAIHWPDGKIGGLGPDWWDPRNHGEYTLYLYPSAMGLMTHTLLLTHYMTGDAKYLEPIRSMAEIRLRYLSAPPAKELEAGTESWCASKMGSLADVVTKYRFLTGNTDFDEFLSKEASAYMRFRLHGDISSLASAVRQSAEALRINFEGYTSEVRYTDRVLRFPALFSGPDVLAKPVDVIHTPDPALLYSMVTGDPGDAGYLPLNAVRWLTRPREIAVLVTESGNRRFAAELFSFSEEERSMAAEFYLLEPGAYELTITAGDGQTSASSVEPMRELLSTHDFVVMGRSRGNSAVRRPSRQFRRTRVNLTLPPRRLCVLRISPRQA